MAPCQWGGPWAPNGRRAELTAALWAISCNRHACLVIDNQYVACGIIKVVQGTHAKLLNGPDADLWQQMVDLSPTTPASWIPSHMTVAQCEARGYSLDDRAGNERADRLAVAALHGLRPHPTVVQERKAQLAAICLAQEVAIATHCSHLSLSTTPLTQRKQAGTRRKRRSKVVVHARRPQSGAWEKLYFSCSRNM